MSDPSDLSISIPWKVIAASPDMMDVNYNNRRFPPAWHSSLAISVYEPEVDELPSNLCDQKIAFVKVTCSLTGFQPVKGISGDVNLGDEPLEELERLTTEYLGCYGALLNVAFFPPPPIIPLGGGVPNLANYPHILDFSPKSRELVRSMTESGDTLTGSTRNIRIDQSHTTTQKNETTLSAEATVEAGGGDSGGLKPKLTGRVSHTWGTTTEDTRGLSVETGGILEQRKSYSTDLDQLYSLLTGYHSGTNRATFIMLARPGTQQATNRRTFALGLRMLEGVQDFIFIVSRPVDQDSLCIEASLNTGHYPEEVELTGEEQPKETKQFLWHFTRTARGGRTSFEGGEQITFPSREDDTFHLPFDEGGQWYVDIAGGSPIELITNNDSPLSSSNTLYVDEFWLVIVPLADQISVQAIGRLDAEGGDLYTDGHDVIVDRTYAINAWRPGVASAERTALISQMLITTRGLSVCYQTVNGCPQVIEPPGPITAYPSSEYGVVEPPIRVNTGVDQIYQTIKSALIVGATSAASGVMKRKYTETDYFSRKVAYNIPKIISQIKLDQAIRFKKGSRAQSILGGLTIKEFLATGLRTINRKGGLKDDASLRIRRDVLQYVEKKLQNG